MVETKFATAFTTFDNLSSSISMFASVRTSSIRLSTISVDSKDT